MTRVGSRVDGGNTMADAHYKISVREDENKYLSVGMYKTPTSGDPTTIYHLALSDVDKAFGIDWTARDIPGTSAKLLIKSGGLGDGQVVTWVGASQDLLLLRDYSPGDQEQIVRFDELDGGFVAINNHDKTHVMDWRTFPLQGSSMVIHFPWNGGWNQQWLLRDH